MQQAAAPTQRDFTARDRHKLSKARQEAQTARLWRRLQAVLLLAPGYTLSEVIGITGLARSSVYYWVQQYLQTHQLASLQDRARSGRPPVAAAVSEQQLRRALASWPRALGYSTNVCRLQYQRVDGGSAGLSSQRAV